MPDLPNVGLERDIEQFIEFFENPAFRADGLKIYPTLVIRGTGLYELWKTGKNSKRNQRFGSGLGNPRVRFYVVKFQPEILNFETLQGLFWCWVRLDCTLLTSGEFGLKIFSTPLIRIETLR